MSKHCETFDHTADVGLAARADTLSELFEALAEGLANVICPRRQVAAKETRQVSATAEDLEALAVDFLSEVTAIMQTEHFMLVSVRVRKMSAASVKAELAGEPYDPARHEIATEVKAVTYHQLKIAREGRLWTGRVILDI
ncbi:MAG: archease [Planctomycetota bacterium]|jgi:SHS2 domain-containing protein